MRPVFVVHAGSAKTLWPTGIDITYLRRLVENKKTLPNESKGVCRLVIFRDQNRRCGPVGFRDDPELSATGRVIDREEPRAFGERVLVGLLVIFVPPLQKRTDQYDSIVPPQRIHRAR